jgi:N6-adenosine-specific RNA methylase IME4
LTKTEKEKLEESILAEGCRDALVTWNGILIDGHHRYEICRRNNIPFNVIEKEFDDRQAVKAWMIANQLGRRNLTPEKFAYMLGRLYEERKQEHGGDRKSSDQNDHLMEKTAEIIADKYKTSAPTVRRAAAFSKAVDAIAETLGDEVKDEILNREIDITRQEVIEIAKHDKEIQKREIEKIRKRDDKAFETPKVKAIPKTDPLPEGKYRVIYADPPWEYSNSGFATSAANQYPTMTTEEICNLPVKQLTGENAVLFLWATNPLLEDALKVCNAWCFAYKTNFTWVKNQHTGGFYCYGQHELLLVAVKGSLLPNHIYSSVINAMRREHSRKPDEVYGIIETMYDGPYIELFARTKRDGWSGWGFDYGLFQSTD